MTARRLSGFILLSLLLVATFLFAGCGSKEVPSTDPDIVRKELVGKKWICHMLFRREAQGDNLTLEFHPDGKVTGTGGCNTFTGEYFLAADSLSFGPMTATDKTCSPAVDEQEFTFLSFLARIKRVHVEGDQLELYSDAEIVPMQFSTGSDGLFW